MCSSQVASQYDELYFSTAGPGERPCESGGFTFGSVANQNEGIVIKWATNNLARTFYILSDTRNAATNELKIATATMDAIGSDLVGQTILADDADDATVLAAIQDIRDKMPNGGKCG